MVRVFACGSQALNLMWELLSALDDSLVSSYKYDEFEIKSNHTLFVMSNYDEARKEVAKLINIELRAITYVLYKKGFQRKLEGLEWLILQISS